MAKPKTPALTVDVVIKSEEDGMKVVLVRRANEPFKGSWALPGGFVEVGESVEDAAVREVEEETGLKVELVRLVGVYSDPERDPRGHNVSVAYLARGIAGDLAAGTGDSEAELLDTREVSLAFDHRRIIDDALSVDTSTNTGPAS